MVFRRLDELNGLADNACRDPLSVRTTGPAFSTRWVALPYRFQDISDDMDYLSKS
jgi:hypothetical protein